MSIREHETTERRRIRRKHKPLSESEAARRRWQAERDRLAGHRDRVLTFVQWCALNGFSEATGDRILKSGKGPPVIALSTRRRGIRESDNATWQASRAR
jgi:predicted DNA-binding transcriptional regulator AlpA